MKKRLIIQDEEEAVEEYKHGKSEDKIENNHGGLEDHGGMEEEEEDPSYYWIPPLDKQYPYSGKFQWLSCEVNITREKAKSATLGFILFSQLY